MSNQLFSRKVNDNNKSYDVEFTPSARPKMASNKTLHFLEAKTDGMFRTAQISI